MEPILETTMLQYFHLRDDFGRPFGTICYDRSQNDGPIGIAICHENDQFVKEIGRTISYGRMKIRRKNRPFPNRRVFVDGLYQDVCGAVGSLIKRHMQDQQELLPA